MSPKGFDYQENQMTKGWCRWWMDIRRSLSTGWIRKSQFPKGLHGNRFFRGKNRRRRFCDPEWRDEERASVFVLFSVGNTHRKMAAEWMSQNDGGSFVISSFNYGHVGYVKCRCFWRFSTFKGDRATKIVRMSMPSSPSRITMPGVSQSTSVGLSLKSVSRRYKKGSSNIQWN